MLLDIEIFAVLFRSKTRIYPLKFWHILEVFGYEPINEVQKSLESFEMHSGINSEKLSVLVILFSIFFKYYSDFEGVELVSIDSLGLNLRNVEIYQELDMSINKTKSSLRKSTDLNDTVETDGGNIHKSSHQKKIQLESQIKDMGHTGGLKIDIKSGKTIF
jgi:hypothetical protein